MGKIFVLIQSEGAAIHRVSLEAINGARQLRDSGGHSLHAVFMGSHDPPAPLTGCDIDEILHINHALLDEYSPDGFIAAAEALIAQESPDIIIAGHTYQARDWLPRLAVRLGLPMISDCTGFEPGGRLTWLRPIFQGKISAAVTTADGPVMVSFQAGTFRSDDLGTGAPAVRAIDLDLSGVVSKVLREPKFQEAKGTVDLSRAERIVSVGRGIGEQEHMKIVEELAAVLGAEIGSSRPVVDYGWLAHDRQVGSSGQTVTPKLYLAIGISGAIQHQVGMKNSGCIVAINKDAHAPIFEVADYGIVADLHEIVPALIQALKGEQ